MITRLNRLFWLLFTGLVPGFLIGSCNREDKSEKIIVTQVPVSESHFYYNTAEGRFVKHAGLLLINRQKSDSPEMLTSGFSSACSPNLSWDGKILLFAGQKNENDTWQIWKMDLKTRKIQQITNDTVNCTDPLYLPTGRIIFSKLHSVSGTESMELFAVNGDGTDLRQITFHPHNNLLSAILKDGRLISVTQQLVPVAKDPYLMVLRPDGTKADLFHSVAPGSVLLSRVKESDNGKIYFIESDPALSKGMILSVDYNRPLFTSVNYTGSLPGSFIAVHPLENGNLLTAWRTDEKEPYALYEFDSYTKKPGRKVYGTDDNHIIDVVLVNEQTRPKKLPSEVDLGVKTGLLLCQDVNFTGLGIENDPGTISHRIEIAGIDSSMGFVDTEKDGSIYLKIIADRPFRIRKLDANNKSISESAWIWLRPNERRGCIGCHENPELAPENRVPLSVKKSPVSIPVHVSGIIEKDVELE